MSIQSFKAAPSAHDPVQELTTVNGGIELKFKGSTQPLSRANFFKRSLHRVRGAWLNSASFSDTEFPSSFEANLEIQYQRMKQFHHFLAVKLGQR